VTHRKSKNLFVNNSAARRAAISVQRSTLNDSLTFAR
jgi:hypothetical protein